MAGVCGNTPPRERASLAKPHSLCTAPEAQGNLAPCCTLPWEHRGSCRSLSPDGADCCVLKSINSGSCNGVPGPQGIPRTWLLTDVWLAAKLGAGLIGFLFFPQNKKQSKKEREGKGREKQGEKNIFFLAVANFSFILILTRSLTKISPSHPVGGSQSPSGYCLGTMVALRFPGGPLLPLCGE